MKKLEKCGGVWDKIQLQERINSALKEKLLVEDLKTQLRFHKSVLMAKGPSENFHFSEKGISFDSDRLASNLIAILDRNFADAVEQSTPAASIEIIGNYRDHVILKKRDLSKSIFEARRKRSNTVQVNSLLPIYLNEPKALCSKQVYHKCLENGEVEWFCATVMSVNTFAKAPKEPLKTVYDIIYDICPDVTYSFPLLVDLKKGDLVIQ